MLLHSEIGPPSFQTSRKLFELIRNSTVQWGGNQVLKIYGRLDCKSGKRMKHGNRVFFKTTKEAIARGYRPCGHCMRAEYREWKRSNVLSDRQTSP